MAYPTPSPTGSSAASTTANCSGTGFPQPPSRGSAGEHLLEKLEFALAVAITRGDAARSQALRDQIAALGGNSEEPGT
jgi:hypothetical protein